MELLRSTQADDGGEQADEGRGASTPSTAKRSRRVRRPAAEEKTAPRNLRLTDDVHDRLWQRARELRLPIGQVANAILDRGLPRYKVEREG
jgi:hypothetical protein